MRRLLISSLLLPIGSLALATSVLAAEHAPGQASVELVPALQVAVLTDLHFGHQWIPASGQRHVDVVPNQNGDLTQGEGLPRAAVFRLSGAPGARVQVYTGARGQYRIAMRRVGGNEELEARVFIEWPNNQEHVLRLNDAGYAHFFVGGRLTIRANNPPGLYLGDFHIFVDHE